MTKRYSLPRGTGLRRLRDNPHVGIATVFKAWLAGKSKESGNVSTNGQTIFSYATWIASKRRIAGRVPEVVWNKTKYSVSTSRQQSALLALIREEMKGGGALEGWALSTHSEHVARGDSASIPRSNPRKRGGKRNPPLVTFGNPRSGEVMSKDVCEIRYKHSEDGQYYKHPFTKGQVILIASANPKEAVLRRVDGNPLIGDY